MCGQLSLVPCHVKSLNPQQECGCFLYPQKLACDVFNEHPECEVCSPAGPIWWLFLGSLIAWIPSMQKQTLHLLHPLKTGAPELGGGGSWLEKGESCTISLESIYYFGASLNSCKYHLQMARGDQPSQSISLCWVVVSDEMCV